MFKRILIPVIVIMAGIFFLGFIGHLVYLLVTPSFKLSTDDFKKKNILCRWVKFKK